MNNSGQTLFDPTVLFSSATGPSIIIYAGLLFGIAYYLRKHLLQNHCPSCTSQSYWGGITATAFLSIFVVLAVQEVALYYVGLLFSVDSSYALRAGVNVVRNLHGRSEFFAVGWAIILFLIGGGYAFSSLDVSLPTHILAFTLSVGPVEELAKALAGVTVYLFLLPRSAQLKRGTIIMAFGIAGLGFGSGEAFHYYAQYRLAGCDLSAYLIRCFWCVPLHFSWTVIVGARAAKNLGALYVVDKARFVDYLWVVFVAAIPCIALHGFYDAFCTHDIFLNWIVGLTSLGWAYIELKRSFGAEDVISTVTVESPSGMVADFPPAAEKTTQTSSGSANQSIKQFLGAVHPTSAADSAPHITDTVTQRMPSASGQCIKCQTINPGDNRFCSECGTLLYKACPSCKIENRLGTKFCGKCGFDLAKHERINMVREQAAKLIQEADRPASDRRLLLAAAYQRLKSALAESPKDEAISQELIQLEVRIREMDRALNEATVKIAEIIEAGKFSEALKMVNESISKLEPSSDLVQLQRKAETGVTLLNQINAHKQGNKAVDACQKMLEVFPSNKEAKGQLDGIVRELETIKKEAIGLIESGSYRQAISKLDHCLKSFEGEMGQPLSALKDLSELREKAQAYENRVKELSAEEIPSFVRKHAFVGVLKALKELGELKADLSGFIEIREQACSAIHEATILVNQASHLHRSKKLTQARDAFFKASDLCSDLPRIHPGLVLVNKAIDSAWSRNAAILVATSVVLLLGLRYSTLAYLDWREKQAWEEVEQGIQSAGPDQAKIKICYQQYLVKHPAGKWAVNAQKTLDQMARDEDARLKKLAEDQKTN